MDFLIMEYLENLRELISSAIMLSYGDKIRSLESK